MGRMETGDATASTPLLFRRVILGTFPAQEEACLVTQAMKFSSPVPVSSAIVCP